MTKKERNYTTANIDKPLYDELVGDLPRTEKTRHINNLLTYAKAKQELAKALYPKMTIASVDDKSMFIRDDPKTPAAEVKYGDSGLHCYKDDSDGCDHVKYALLVPELAKLVFIRKK